MLLLTNLTQNECHQVKARGSWRKEVYVRTFAGARSETSAHYNTGLAPVLTLQSHGLIEFLLLCDGCFCDTSAPTHICKSTLSARTTLCWTAENMVGLALHWLQFQQSSLVL